MRRREEIEERLKVKPDMFDHYNQMKIIVELLLDIRELLQTKEA